MSAGPEQIELSRNDVFLDSTFGDDINMETPANRRPPGPNSIPRQRRPTEASGFQALGIHWAPPDVPLLRRLQTVAVLLHTLGIALLTSAFFLACVNPFFWPLLLLYLIHSAFSTAHMDGTLSGRSELLRRWRGWRLFAGYFPAELHKTTELPPHRRYVFGYHPHGIIGHGAWVAFATDALQFSRLFPDITNTLCTLDSNFRLPLYRDYLLAMGVGSVSRDSVVNILTHGGIDNAGAGRAVTIVVGGAREALKAQPGRMELVLDRRKGFVRIAIACGADLVPVVGFGENDLYKQLDPRSHPRVRSVQEWFLRVLRFTLPVLRGRGIFNYDVGLMPFRRPLDIVVGRPIRTEMPPTGEEPRDAEVDRVHQEYIAELRRLWDTHRHRFGYGSVELVISS